MQDIEKNSMLLKEGQVKETKLSELLDNSETEKKPTVAKLNPAIIVPAPLKRKRLNDELIAELNATYERPAICRDEHGEYKEGAFLHGSNLVITSILEGRWHLTVKSDKPLSIYEIKAARYKFIPDDAYMTLVFPKRSELEKFTSPHSMQMIEIQVTQKE